jgi:uncharacterized protein YjiS (DUF1127 family)
MTISQLTPSQVSKRPWARALNQAIQAIDRWRRRRRARAELAHLVQVGDYLLRDVGLDPKLARMDPRATAQRLMRRR